MVTQYNPHHRRPFKPQANCITKILQCFYYIGKQQDKQRCRQYRPLPEASNQTVEPDHDEEVSPKGTDYAIMHFGSDEDLCKQQQQTEQEIRTAESEHILKSALNYKVKYKT